MSFWQPYKKSDLRVFTLGLLIIAVGLIFGC